MSPEMFLVISVRVIAATMATVFAWHYWQDRKPISLLARRLMLSIVVFGLWCLVLGGLTTIGLVPSIWADGIYTVFAGYTAVILYSILREED